MSRYPSMPFVSGFLWLVLGAAFGLSAGYYKWGQAVQAPGEASVQVAPAFSESMPALLPESVAAPDAFAETEAAVLGLISRRRYSMAIDKLVELDLLAATASELNQVTALLEEAVKLRVLQLQGRERFGEIDTLYESLTYAMPERAEYYLLLAEHRIHMKNADAALPVLAQIENHSQLGGRARELIAQLSASAKPQLAAAPMLRRGDQFLVNVEIDGRRQARLLLDTGASMTVLEPAVIAALGYQPGERMASFSTANGVLQAPVVNLGSLALAGVQVDGLDVGVLTLSGKEVDGLLGMDYLSRFEFDIDQERSILRLVSAR